MKDKNRRCASCLVNVKEEFSLKNLTLDYDAPVDFVKLQCGPSFLFIGWSACWAILHLLGLGLQPYFHKDVELDLKWFSYLTYWGYTTLGIFTLWDCVTSVYVHIRRRDIIKSECTVMPWYLKAAWVQFNINTPVALVITILFYLFIPNDTSPNSILVHAMNTVYVSANVIICAKPMRVLHLVHPFIYGFVYLIFSVIYQKTTNNVVYVQLDWENMPQTALFMLGVLFLILPLLYLMCLVVTRTRTLVHKKLCGKRATVSPMEIEENPSDECESIKENKSETA
ncbi:protein rolling stone-like isoform X1 [Crassostrea angulata]|uniref:protein rolling stone-like isoform X1 n=1 Tax=Magallana angulata TaxID=2784310 RepID=UPI0022B0BCA1|nr:protein rolling stone-like isoform X1 [Crassostrea angulata]